MTDETAVLPDGSAITTVSLPLPEDHWIYEPTGEPPAAWRCGSDNPIREDAKREIYEAAKYAVRGATMNGKAMDFDPDALCQNMVIGLLGYNQPVSAD